ncbi:MAG: hydantoinase/oxoprolinase family protein [Pararhodobacter sp.]
MALLLGVDTGGTYTDAVVLDDTQDRILAKAKALTTRPDLSVGIGAAIDAVLAALPDVAPADIAMVSLSTTLATNALVEGQGSRAALVLIGFDEAERQRAGLAEALGDAPLIELPGGHGHAGDEVAPLDLARLEAALAALPPGCEAIAVAARFATRNPAHERAAKERIRALTGLPVTCSHELSAALNGPRRALTALLNARLIAMIDRLIDACETHLSRRGIAAPLLAVRGDGALVSAALVRERPIETILSGPAASIAGAAWLTGQRNALVSDIGGTTTDVCLLRDGRPAIDPLGAQVGGFRTMVEAVAMRTTGLGGDSEVHVAEGLAGGLRLGPRRLMPLSLAAMQHPDLVHRALDNALSRDPAPEETWRFAVPLFTALPAGLPPREAALAARLAAGPMRLSDLLTARIEGPALTRLVQRGVVLLSGLTPSDAAHALNRQSGWDREAALKGLTLMARRRGGDGERLAPGPEAMAQRIIDQMTAQTVDCLLEAAFAEDPHPWPQPPETLARHALMARALDRADGLIALSARLGVPVIGLGASAGCYYPAVGARLGCEMIVPEHAGVANAIGAVVGQVSQRADGQVTCPAPGEFIAHLSTGPMRCTNLEDATHALEADLRALAVGRAQASGVVAPRVTLAREDVAAEIEGQRVLIELRLSVTAQGRPSIATR